MHNGMESVGILNLRPIVNKFQTMCTNCGGIVSQETTVGIVDTGTFKCPFCDSDLYINPKTLFRDFNEFNTDQDP